MICSKSHKKPLPVLGLLLFIVPAIQYGCSDVIPVSCQNSATSEMSATKTVLPLSGSVSTDGACLDIFTFNDDDLQRLDSYTRIEHFSGTSIPVTSQSGQKIILICANARRDLYDWAEISSLGSIRSMTVSLEKESAEAMTMTGICRTTAGDECEEMVMTPVASEIVLRSLGCDFSGLPYAGKELTEVKVYLTNVNAEAYIYDRSNAMPLRIINMGMLNNEDVSMFKEPELIVKNVDGKVSGSSIRTNMHFICYPNCAETESPGSPFTRLVIEGKIDGDTYYWPVNINRQNEGTGIERNCRYVFDLVIRRKGTTDPDIPVRHEDIETTLEIMPWKEMQEEYIEF